MTDEELKEMQEEFPNAWWNLNHEEYEVTSEDFYRAWKEDCGDYIRYAGDYLSAGWSDWYEENWDEYYPEHGDAYSSLTLNALMYEKWNIAEALDGDYIERDVVMEYLMNKEMRKQMQWLLDHNCHRRDDHLWSTWQRLCFEWDNESDEDEEEDDDDVESLKEKIGELKEEIDRLQSILDENGIDY